MNSTSHHHHHDIWHVNYNETVASQAAKGWSGIGVVLLVNTFLFGIAIIVFSTVSRSGMTSLYTTGTNAPGLPGTSAFDRFRRFLKSFNNISSLHLQVGEEGAFYLCFQLYAFRLLTFLTAMITVLLLPLYIISGVTNSHHSYSTFEIFTVRTIENESAWLWLPVICVWVTTFGFLFFIQSLSVLCSTSENRRMAMIVTPSIMTTPLLTMRPSALSAQSVFVDRGIPSRVTEERLTSVLQHIFPSYIKHVAVVLNLKEYQTLLNRRKRKELELERLLLTEQKRADGTLPQTLVLCPGTALYPTFTSLCCASRAEDVEMRLLRAIRSLHDAETSSLRRTVNSAVNAGRAFIVFSSARYKASFVRRVRNRSLDRIVNRLRDDQKPEAIEALKEIDIASWHLLPAPEPDDIDWSSVSYPFVTRTMSIILINVVIVLLLLVFTSPVAIAGAFASSKYSFVFTNSVDSVGDYVSSLSPAFSDMIFAYVPTLILVMINAVLLNMLDIAGRFQPMHTDSGKEKSIMITSTIYLVFNTLFVPSFAFVSIDAVLVYLQNKGQILDFLGKMFLHNSGTFFVNYVIQRAFVGTAVTLLRLSEGLQFMWFNSRAVTEKEKKDATTAWRFYTGTQFALQISVLAVVISFSTVVPVIVPFGALYMLLTHLVDKYSLLYVRPRIQGRGAIARTATHTAVFALLLYQAGMVGFFYVRGSALQSSSVVILWMLTYVVTIWWYVTSKQSEYDDAELSSNTEGEQSSLLLQQHTVDLYHQPPLRKHERNPDTHSDVYGTVLG